MTRWEWSNLVEHDDLGRHWREMVIHARAQSGKPRDSDPGRVYFARVDGCGTVKVGFSKNPKERMYGLTCPCGCNCRPVVKWDMEGARVEEMATQVLFGDFWLEGHREWFSPAVWPLAERLREALGA